MAQEALGRRAGGRIVSTAPGPLRHLLLYFPQEAAARHGYRSAYRDLLSTLPAATRLTVLVHPKVADVLHRLVVQAGRTATTTAITSDQDLRFTVWAQDPCLVLQDDDGRLALLTPDGFEREHDAGTCDVLAEAIGGPGAAQSRHLPWRRCADGR